LAFFAAAFVAVAACRRGVVWYHLYSLIPQRFLSSAAGTLSRLMS
jgi:hypothetical protein